MAEQRQRQASRQPAEDHSQQRQAGPRSRKTRQSQLQTTDPLQRLQELANSSPRTAQLRRLQELANNSPQVNELRQLQAMAQGAEPSTAKPERATPKPNLTGLPDRLKSNLEALSGLSMDAVRVHYNSNKPAQLTALAYTQGTDIHLSPGQEQHLPHEAWHVVQQAQGRVRPTMQMAGGVAVNDDAGLEREADVMGWRAAIQPKPIDPPSMAVPYLMAQLKTTVNSKDLAKKSINFGKDFEQCHWAETEEHAKFYSIERTKNSNRGMINTVIKGNLGDIKGMVIDADAKLAGKANSETLITISGEYWQVNVIKSADDSKVKSCDLLNGNVKLKGYLQKGSGLKITGVYG